MLKSICYDYFPVSYFFLQSFLYGFIDWSWNAFLLEIVEGHSKRTCAYDGGSRVNICHFGTYILIE